MTQQKPAQTPEELADAYLKQLTDTFDEKVKIDSEVRLAAAQKELDDIVSGITNFFRSLQSGLSGNTATPFNIGTVRSIKPEEESKIPPCSAQINIHENKYSKATKRFMIDVATVPDEQETEYMWHLTVTTLAERTPFKIQSTDTQAIARACIEFCQKHIGPETKDALLQIALARRSEAKKDGPAPK